MEKQEKYKTTEFVGYHKFVRFSSLDSNAMSFLGHDKEQILKDLNLSAKACSYITFPIYEEHRIHERFEFVSHLDFLTIHFDAPEGEQKKYSIVTVPEFCELSMDAESAEEIRAEYDL